VASEIERLKEIAVKAAKRGDIDTLRQADIAIRNLEAGAPAAGFEKQDIEPIDSTLGSIGLGAARTLGNFATGAQDLHALTQFDAERRRELRNKEAEAQDIFKQKTANNPYAAFAGEMIPYLPFGGGATAGRAAFRGALPGLLGYTESPEERLAMMAAGGGANLLGRKAPGLLNPDVLRTQQQGMRMTPEQRVASPLDTLVSSLRSSKSSGQKVARFNQKQITEEALSRLGVRGDTFSDDTLGMVAKETGEMFNDAVGGGRNIFLGGVAKTKLLVLLEPELKVLRPKGEGKALLTDFLDDIESGKGIMSVKNYQNVRSKFTKAMLKTTDADRKLAMGQVIELLDNSAARSLASQPKQLKKLQAARKRWRDFVLISSPGVVNDAGRINTGKLRTLLNRKDRGGFMLNRDTQKLAEMLRLDRRGPQVGSQADPFTITNMLTWPIERTLIGANRLPTRAVESGPLAATMPLLRPDANRDVQLNLDPILNR